VVVVQAGQLRRRMRCMCPKASLVVFFWIVSLAFYTYYRCAAALIDRLIGSLMVLGCVVWFPFICCYML
jgi:hypothetical protein